MKKESKSLGVLNLVKHQFIERDRVKDVSNQKHLLSRNEIFTWESFMPYIITSTKGTTSIYEDNEKEYRTFLPIKIRTKIQKEGIIEIAVSAMGKQKFHDKSKDIIVWFLENKIHEEIEILLIF